MVAVNTIQRTVSDGVQTSYSIPFPFLDKSHVEVLLDGVLTEDFSWLGSANISFPTAPASGVVVERHRTTPAEPLTVFLPGNLDTDDLNAAALQPLYLAQEARDRADDVGLRGWVTKNYGTGGTIEKGTGQEALLFDGDGNASGFILDAVEGKVLGWGSDRRIENKTLAELTVAAPATPNRDIITGPTGALDVRTQDQSDRLTAVAASAESARAALVVPYRASSRSQIKALNTATSPMVLFDGTAWDWDGSDLSSKITPRSINIETTVGSGSNQFVTKTVSVSSPNIDVSKDMFTTTTDHGLTDGQEVYSTADTESSPGVKEIVAFHRMFIRFDADTEAGVGGNLRNFKLASSITNPAVFNITVNTAVTLRVPLNVQSGDCVYVPTTQLGLTANTLMYIRKVNNGVFKLYNSYANARGTGTTGEIAPTSSSAGLVLKFHADPLEGLYVVPDGLPIDGSQGAYKRRVLWVETHHHQGFGTGSSDDSHALYAAHRCAYYMKMLHHTAAGNWNTKFPIQHETNEWAVDSIGVESPGNGITWVGDGPGRTVITVHADFADGQAFLRFDGNPNAVNKLMPNGISLGQGKTFLRGITGRGKGKAVGSVRGVEVRGCWEMLWEDVELRDFSGTAVVSMTGATVSPGDEVDNTAFWDLVRCKVLNCGSHAFHLKAARIANLRMRGCHIRDVGGVGLRGCLAYSHISETTFATCGNRADATTGGIQLVDADTGSLSRTVAINDDNVFENNWYYDVDVAACRGIKIEGNSFHIMQQTGGTVTGKASIILRCASASSTHSYQVSRNRWPLYSAASDVGTPAYLVYSLEVRSGVIGGSVEENVAEHPTNAHMLLQTANGSRIWQKNTALWAYATSGTAPVDCFYNGKSIGTLSGGDYTRTVLTTDRTLADDATVQELFPSDRDEHAIAAGRAYHFMVHFEIARTAGTTAHTLSFLGGGTATWTAVGYQAATSQGNQTAPAAQSVKTGAAFSAVVITNSNNATDEVITGAIVGFGRANAAGTLKFQVQYSAGPGQAPTVKAAKTWAIVRDFGPANVGFDGAVS